MIRHCVFIRFKDDVTAEVKATMQNGIIFSSSCGTRNSDVSATISAEAFGNPDSTSTSNMKMLTNTPIYPFAFAALTFAFLGTPRTTRQSRNFSMGCAIGAVFGLRMAGFAASVMAAKSDFAAPFQYLMLFTAIGGSLWIIAGGIVIEPPAGLMDAINRWNARLLRLFGRPVTT
eukprot:gene40615-54915_t